MIVRQKQKTMAEAAAMVSDGDVFALNGMGHSATGWAIFKEIEARFLETGHPQNLTLYSACGVGDASGQFCHMQHLAHSGLIRRLIVGHWEAYRAFTDLLKQNEMEGYVISQGILSILFGEIAAGKPGYLSKVGLYSFVDPRFGHCGFKNDISTECMVEHVEFKGEEYLYYKAVPPNVCVLQGSYADQNGNISFENETLVNDALSMAMAAHNNKGKVIVLVEKIDEKAHFNAHRVCVPGFLVDAIVVNESYVQAYPLFPFNESVCGKVLLDEEEAVALINDLSKHYKKDYDIRRVIARRAALEIRPNDVVNLGLGIPVETATERRHMGLIDDSVTLTLEVGAAGGMPIPVFFGTVINPLAIYEQASQFRFYEGGGLDIGILGALEVDRHGNVNVSQAGGLLAGLGGFPYIAYSSTRLVFCLKFGTGPTKKFVNQVELVTMNADFHRRLGKSILYVTERCVFRLIDTGLELIEIAPGVDLQRDILDHMEFLPAIASKLKTMPAVCFET